jgi:SAM-dependent methyltransferase
MLGVILVAAGILSPVVGLLCLAYYAGMIEVLTLHLTKKWYGVVVQGLKPKSRLLDVGSGLSGVRTFSELISGCTFGTLIGTVRILLAMEVSVVGIEPDGVKFKKAAESMQRAELRHTIVLHCNSICDKSLRQVFGGQNNFNTVCFSSPLMSLPDPVAALRAAGSLLKEGGVVYVPQVLSAPPSMAFRILSPLFKILYIFPIAEIKDIVEEAEMEVIDDLPASGEDEKGKAPHAARVLVLQRRAHAARMPPW